MMKRTHKLSLSITIVALVCMLAFTSQGSNVNQATSKPLNKPTFDFERYTKNKPFKLNTLQTTPYGPPWADITLQKSNFLECKGASIALCYYSGPGPTTPCTLDGLGIANCTCYEIPSGQRYLVDINAILNLDVYLKTVDRCGKDGSKCQPTGSIEAPVCQAINDNTLIPGADLVSAFSLYLEKQLPISPTTCGTPQPMPDA